MNSTLSSLSPEQYVLIYNAFSFAIATFASSTIFFWLGRSQVGSEFKTAITITGLVTFIEGVPAQNTRILLEKLKKEELK